jgi:hypothetical protein
MSASSPAFHERLLPGAGALAAVVGAGLLALVILLPVDPVAAVVAAVVVAAAGVGWLLLGAPRLSVRDGELWAGRAHVPVTLLGEPTVLATREAMRDELGARLDARAHVLLRSWVPAGVRVPLHDPADPTPYWLLSTRRPEELAAALRAGSGTGADVTKAVTPEV